MRNARTLAIVAVSGLAIIFSSPLVARAKKPVSAAAGGEPQTGGLPALEDRVEFDEGLIAVLTTQVTTLETLVASAMHRLSAEFQNFGSGANEIFTSLPPIGGGTGGITAYSKTLSIPFDVVHVTFSAQGDSHGGAALSMSANVTDSATATTTVCQPMAGSDGGGGGTAGPPGWMTLNKLPTNPAVDTMGGAPNNCNDGGGGSADCHDNAIMFSCCERITPDTAGTTHTVEIRLASQPNPLTPMVAGNAFYERSSIYIDASADPGGTLCSGVNTANH